MIKVKNKDFLKIIRMGSRKKKILNGRAIKRGGMGKAH